MCIPAIALCLSLAPGLYFFGMIYLAVLLGLALVVLGSFIIRVLYQTFKDSWQAFQEEQEAERQTIIDKLKAPAPVYEPPRLTPQEILALLRKKAGP